MYRKQMKRLNWLDLGERMDDHRIPTWLLCSDREEKYRMPEAKLHRPDKEWYKEINSDTNSWQRSSTDRATWRTLIRNGDKTESDKGKKTTKTCILWSKLIQGAYFNMGNTRTIDSWWWWSSLKVSWIVFRLAFSSRKVSSYDRAH